ncbi:hypothetical protein COEREDRAFT_11531 [Coemansia reversa NRRL 1564]|uniref:Uncharacterized protein n=1 Tax=Coemansia reversa (strain ATCC 12441 / NRRL 1564) TaxID=763665 RepID=A0A2G5B3T5_COERN|nr:hypothetical protein COEREDRAFT_11531 [Coemansia reversa NRRL 1564]|eukprot:PIA13377.1 hypothetical protein COEREDRAFT_11531 [Coemansia reversa NRRL 1564]
MDDDVEAAYTQIPLSGAVCVGPGALAATVSAKLSAFGIAAFHSHISAVAAAEDDGAHCLVAGALPPFDSDPASAGNDAAAGHFGTGAHTPTTAEFSAAAAEFAAVGADLPDTAAAVVAAPAAASSVAAAALLLR